MINLDRGGISHLSRIRDTFTSALIFKQPDLTLSFTVEVDVSEVGVRTVTLQCHGLPSMCSSNHSDWDHPVFLCRGSFGILRNHGLTPTHPPDRPRSSRHSCGKAVHTFGNSCPVITIGTHLVELCHPGITWTLNLLSCKFCWPSIIGDFHYVRSCPICFCCPKSWNNYRFPTVPTDFLSCATWYLSLGCLLQCHLLNVSLTRSSESLGFHKTLWQIPDPSSCPGSERTFAPDWVSR